MTVAYFFLDVHIQRRDIFEFLKTNNLISNPSNQETLQRVLSYVKIKIDKENLSPDADQEIFSHLKQFSCNLLTRWKKCHQNYNQFLKKYSHWLEKDLISSETNLNHKRSVGRPTKSFMDSGIRTKKNKVASLVQLYTPEELALAAEISYRATGKRNVAKLINEATTSSPESVKRAKTIFEVSNNEPTFRPYSPNEALALIVDLKLTKHQYVSMQKGASDHNVSLYPPYYLVLKSKSECYPMDLLILENSAEVKLQNLLDHTIKRLLQVQDEVVVQILNGSDIATPCFLTLECKWGLDGSGGHSLYKQNFSKEYGDTSDSDILLTSLVPLQLHFVHNAQKIIAWQNPRSSSTRFCRPVRFQFIKETSETARREVEYIENQITALTPTKIILSTGQEIFVQFSLFKTMVDGKVCNSLMNNSSSQACYICGVCPKDMNNLEEVMKRPVKENSYNFGLSTLHAHIRFFECILHLSYRLEIKKWQVRGSKQEKDVFELRKKLIIKRFKSEMGLLVDVVKQGYGSTNDGNTARRFFEDCDKSSEITGVDKQLIYRFSVVLQTLSSGYDINVKSFKTYALETAKLFVNLYPWFYMPASIHKILIHGADVIDSLILPIGQLSEDVQEARHKEYRYYREHNTRKMSRLQTNEDLMHMFLISSDPLISNIRKLPTKKASLLCKDVLDLLKVPELSNSIF